MSKAMIRLSRAIWPDRPVTSKLCAGFVSGLAVLVAGTAAVAQQPKESFVSPVLDGHHSSGAPRIEKVFIIEHPADWVPSKRSCCQIHAPDSPHEHYYGGSTFGFNWVTTDWAHYLDWAQTGPREKIGYPWTLEIIPEDVDLGTIINHSKAFAEGRARPADIEGLLHPCYLIGHVDGQCVEFERKHVTLGGLEGVFRAYSKKPLWNTETGEQVEPLGPTEFEVFLLVDKSQVLRVGFIANTADWSARLDAVDVYARSLPTLEEMLATLRFVSPDEVGGTIVLTEPYESPGVRLSQRRNFHVDADFTAEKPVDWEARESLIIEASAENEQGILAVEFIAPESEAEDFAARLIVTLHGLPVGSLTVDDFLATTTEYLTRDGPMLSEVKETSRRQQNHGGLAFLARLKPAHGESTQATFVREFEGSVDGEETLLVKAHTAGGLTVAANILFVAEPQRMAELAPTVDKVVESIRVQVYSPVIKF